MQPVVEHSREIMLKSPTRLLKIWPKATIELHVLMSKMSTQERKRHSTNTVGIEEEGDKKCLTNKGLAHDGPYQVEEAQFVNDIKSYNFMPNNNLPTHCTPTLRNHENFSYGSEVQHDPRPVQNFHQQYAP